MIKRLPGRDCHVPRGRLRDPLRATAAAAATISNMSEAETAITQSDKRSIRVPRSVTISDHAPTDKTRRNAVLRRTFQPLGGASGRRDPITARG